MKYWLMRAGNDGEARNLFLDEGVIAMDWDVGDLGLFPADRKLFMKAYFDWAQKAYQQSENPQHHNPRSLAQEAGTNYSFVHQIETGDGVVFAPKKAKDPHLYLGQIEGAYYFNPHPHPQLIAFKHQRKVTWQVLDKLRTEYPKELVYMIEHYLGTLCQIKAVHHPELAAMLKS